MTAMPSAANAFTQQGTSGMDADAVSSRTPADASRPIAGPQISWLTFTNILLRRRRLVLLVPFVFLLVAVIRGIMYSYTFSSSATFMPQGQQSVGAGPSLAAQFGFSLPGAEFGNSPAFYVDLLRSRHILRDVVQQTYEFGPRGRTRKGTLVDVFGLRHLPAGEGDQSARGMLEQTIRPETQKTGVITITVTTNSASLSQQIAANLLKALERFNRETRQTQAAAERRFTEERLAQASSALHVAEDRLRAFLEENRVIGVPRLSVERDRLDRNVATQQQIYNVLAQAYERAKIDEVRDSPVITIIDQPEAPAYPNSRKLPRALMVALFTGLLLGGFLALLTEYLSFSRAAHSSAQADFERLRRDAVSDIIRPWRLLRPSAKSNS